MRCFSVITCGSRVYASSYNVRHCSSSWVKKDTCLADDAVPSRDLHRLALNRSLKMFERLFYSNSFQYFVTLTVSPSLRIDRSDYGACKSAVTSSLNRFIKQFPGSTYLLVPDFHSDGSYHFHGFFSLSCSVTSALRRAGHFRLFKQGARRMKYYSPLINRLLGRNEFRPLIHCFDEKCLQYALKYVVKASSLVQLAGHSLYIRSRGLVECTSRETYLGDDAELMEAVFNAFNRSNRHSYVYDVNCWSPMSLDEWRRLDSIYLHSLFNAASLAPFPARSVFCSAVQLSIFPLICSEPHGGSAAIA